MSIWMFSVLSLMTLCQLGASTKRVYTAAAYEHKRFGELDTDPPDVIINENLKSYERAAEIAASKAADIIVYPESGLYFPGNRTVLKQFLEYIPDPKKFDVNPCEETKLFSDRPILHRLSCIAKNYSFYVVANTGDIQTCAGDPDCPEDGSYHYNTNVVFDRNGKLILRYYKEHLYFELGMDLPKEQQDPIFETDFGTFATYICFDILFNRMSEVAKWPQVDGIMYSAMWSEASPQYSSVPLWQGWALGNNATIVVSNIQIPGYTAVGSGIFHKMYGALGYTYNPDALSKIVVAEVPLDQIGSAQPNRYNSSVTGLNETDQWDYTTDGENVPETCSLSLLQYPTNIMEDFRCFDENTVNYTLVKLTEPSGYIEACNNGMCCSVNYSAESMDEDFYLGVFNGTFISSNRYFWCEESCFIARCDEIEGRPCSTFPRRSNTVFHSINIKSNFTTEFVYPSIVSDRVRLVPKSDWIFSTLRTDVYSSFIRWNNVTGENIINAGMKGRCYERDPPYRR